MTFQLKSHYRKTIILAISNKLKKYNYVQSLSLFLKSKIVDVNLFWVLLFESRRWEQGPTNGESPFDFETTRKHSIRISSGFCPFCVVPTSGPLDWWGNNYNSGPINHSDVAQRAKLHRRPIPIGIPIWGKVLQMICAPLKDTHRHPVSICLSLWKTKYRTPLHILTTHAVFVSSPVTFSKQPYRQLDLMRFRLPAVVSWQIPCLGRSSDPDGAAVERREGKTMM